MSRVDRSQQQGPIPDRKNLIRDKMAPYAACLEGVTRRLECSRMSRGAIVARNASQGGRTHPKSVWFEDHEMREVTRIFLDEF